MIHSHAVSSLVSLEGTGPSGVPISVKNWAFWAVFRGFRHVALCRVDVELVDQQEDVRPCANVSRLCGTVGGRISETFGDTRMVWRISETFGDARMVWRISETFGDARRGFRVVLCRVLPSQHDKIISIALSIARAIESATESSTPGFRFYCARAP